ncbi:hypothetical protein [Absidia glauca]|uniref:F-box domain-containing protein n=1 Tax=Absidia glauca TaxID=4829 RepID=A0A163K2X4_ABSGL|nr:hypothetical protein [Absidia glauca]
MMDHPCLPLELITIVLKYVTTQRELYQCTLVNSYFFEIANPKLWRRMSTVNHPDRPKRLLHSLKWAATHGRKPFPGDHINSFCISEECPTPLMVTLTAGYARSLRELELSYMHLTRDEMEAIAIFCPLLSVLIFFECTNTFDVLEPIGEHGHNLSTFHVYTCPDEMDLSPLKQCEGLRMLCLAGCPWLTMDRAGNTLLSLDQLDELDISQSPFDDPDRFLEKMIPSEPYQQSRHLTDDSDDSDDNDNDGILPPLGGLTRFGISCDSGTQSNMWFDFLMSRPPHLVTLDIAEESVSDALLSIMHIHLPNLKSLGLNRCSGFSSRGLREMIKQNPGLDILSMRGSRLPRRCFPELKGEGVFLDHFISWEELDMIRQNTEFVVHFSDDDLLPSERETLEYMRSDEYIFGTALG